MVILSFEYDGKATSGIPAKLYLLFFCSEPPLNSRSPHTCEIIYSRTHQKRQDIQEVKIDLRSDDQGCGIQVIISNNDQTAQEVSRFPSLIQFTHLQQRALLADSRHITRLICLRDVNNDLQIVIHTSDYNYDMMTIFDTILLRY